MISRHSRASQDIVAIDGDLVLVGMATAITLAAGHGLRSASCLACRRAIGGRALSVMGVAGLHGDAYADSCIPSDMFLFHSDCVPRRTSRLWALLKQGITESHAHPWN